MESYLAEMQNTYNVQSLMELQALSGYALRQSGSWHTRGSNPVHHVCMSLFIAP